MAANFMQRRSLDPFSDAARFPTLQTAGQDLADASAQHTAAVAGGPNSVAARFDPLNEGSIFSRQEPGAYDAAHDQQLQQDPSNNYYNGGGIARRGDAVAAQPQPQLDATDRYALDTGYQSADSIKGQQGLDAIGRYAIDTGFTPPAPTLRRRVANSSLSFNNGN